MDDGQRWGNGEAAPLYVAFGMKHAPALILALLDALAKTEGRKEAALKALREAGR